MNRRVPHGWLTAALFTLFFGASALPGTAQAPPGLKVQYRAADTNATDNQIKPHLNLVNTGTTAVPLSELTVRVLVREGHDADAGVRLRLRRAGVREHHGPLRDAGAGDRNGGHLPGDRLHARGRRAGGRAADGRDSEPSAQPELGQLQRGERLFVRSDEDGVRRLDEGHAVPQRRSGLWHRAGAFGDRHAAADGAGEPRLTLADVDDDCADVDGVNGQRWRDGLPDPRGHDAGRDQHGGQLYRDGTGSSLDSHLHGRGGRRGGQRIGAEQRRDGDDVDDS